MDIRATKDKLSIKNIMTNKVLAAASMPDEDLRLMAENIWQPAGDCDYLICVMEGKDIAIIRLYSLSNITVDMHYHLLPEYWGKGISSQINTKVEEYLINNTNYCKIVVQTPQCCREVLKAASREGYHLEGILTAAIVWRNNIENIVLMSKFLNRGD